MIRSLLCVLSLAASVFATSVSAEIVHASWYGTENHFHGKQMASGPLFDMNDPYLAAHKTLPFCTQIRLQNPDNSRELTVVVTDRGPYVRNRDYDLSQAGARHLDYLSSGVQKLIVLEVIPPIRKHRYGESCDSYLAKIYVQAN